MMQKNITKNNKLVQFVSGVLKINYMMDLDYNRIDQIGFNAISIRNRGSLIMNNDIFQHEMTGNVMQVCFEPWSEEI